MAGFSAPNAFLTTMFPTLAIQAHIMEYQSEGNTGLPSCPVLTGFSDSGEAELEWSAVGGCTDHTGAEWTGSHEQKMLDTVTVGFISKDFGERSASEECEGKTDSFKFNSFIRMGGLGGESMEMDILFSNEGENAVASAGCELVQSGLGYDVELVRVSEVVDEVEKTTYSQAGEVLAESAEFQGYLNVQTEDEVLFETVCSTEALSGTTTLSNSNDTVVFQYDGETDCDDPGTVTWTLNGEPQGEISGVNCAVSGRSSGGWLVVLGALALTRRRRED
jgi:MYXO-CTERM domain-containing protein